MSTAPIFHGTLNRGLPPRSPDLANASEAALAVELLMRIQAAPPAGNRKATEELHHAEESLREALDAHLDTVTNRWSLTHARTMLGFPRHCQKRFGLPRADGVHVDMGCGSHNPLGRMFVHLMLGAREGICIDLDPPLDLGRALRQLVRLAVAALVDPNCLFPNATLEREQILRNIADFDLGRLSQGDPAGLSPRLQLVQGSILETGLPDASVDAIFTNSVLEHLPELSTALCEWRRITRPGGCAVHGIDLKDHRVYANPDLHPLEFLTEPPGPPIIYSCNRVLLGEYEREFVRTGFSVVETHRRGPVAIPTDLRRRFAAPWRDLPDDELCHTWVSFLLRRD